MFQNLKKLFIYLLLLPRTFTFPINGNHGSEKITPDVVVDEAVVEKELLRYAKYLDKITNDVERAEFKGELKAIVRQAKKAEQLLINQGHLEKEKEIVIRKALKTFVVPYLCRNFEMYEQVWDNGGTNSKDFNLDDNENAFLKQYDLSTQTMENYKHHAKVWDRILTSSKHPSVKIFKDKIESLYTTLTLPMIAKNLGLVHALLDNAKHGAMNDEPEIVKLIDPKSIVMTLKEWKYMKDPVLLSIIKAFEQVISGL